MTLKRANTEYYFQFIDVRIKNLIPNILQLFFYPLSCRVVNDKTKQRNTEALLLREAQNRW